MARKSELPTYQPKSYCLQSICRKPQNMIGNSVLFHHRFLFQLSIIENKCKTLYCNYQIFEGYSVSCIAIGVCNGQACAWRCRHNTGGKLWKSRDHHLYRASTSIFDYELMSRIQLRSPNHGWRVWGVIISERNRGCSKNCVNLRHDNAQV